ncbi:MAG: HD domain-containing protein [Eubacterium sp.]|nr:HD domain-containing protein [Eubacterium sp.]
MDLPDYIVGALQRLNDGGYKAYAVGGCVRDFLLGRQPADYDITTSAKPEDIIRAFEGYHVIPTGIQHGTVTVVIDGVPVEITTFRIDGDYSDHRRPESVSFTDSVEADLSRRDFTVNAMACGLDGEIIDPFGGQSDLEKGVIRAVGDPVKRFNEDALRILRALRFASRYGWVLEENTARAVHELKGLLNDISAERIRDELCGIIIGDCEQIMEDYSDVICEIIPELAPSVGFEQHTKYHNKTVYGHIVAAMCAADKDVVFRLTMLLHDIGKPDAFFMKDGVGHFYGHADISVEIARKVLNRLRFPNKIRDKVLFLVQNHGVVMQDSEKYFRRAAAKYGEEGFFELVKVHIFDNMGKAEQYQYEAEEFRKIQQHAREFFDKEPALSLKNLAVSGGDLITLGYKGIEIGKALDFLLNETAEGKCENDKKKLLGYLEEHYDGDKRG